MNSAVSNLRPHCSSMQKLWYLQCLMEVIFKSLGVSNAKYLAFDTVDKNALTQASYSSSLFRPHLQMLTSLLLFFFFFFLAFFFCTDF